MAKPKPIVARHLFHLRDVVRERHVIATSVGFDLNPVVLSLGKRPDYRTETASLSFAKTEANRPNDFRIHYCVKDQWFTVDIEPTVENMHAVQPLGADHWLLVRCRATSSRDENAHVVDSCGRFVRSFHAGDAIADVQTTNDSKIWCSFFDEGVFHENRMGKSGLVCLDTDGRKLFSYDEIAEKAGYIMDCYALNVFDNRNTWLYYYSGFPLVQIGDFTLASRWQQMPVSGSRAFAILKGHVLFAGSYKEPQSLFQVQLSTLAIQPLIVVTAEGTTIEATSAFGRADRLYLTTADSVFLVEWEV